MTNPLHAPFYADKASQQTVEVVENVRVARDTYRLRVECPPIARCITPGQFLMIRLAGCDDPLLGRPLALYDTVLAADGQPACLDVVYLVLGKMTRRLAEIKPGRRVQMWGPLGNGFLPQAGEHLIMVGGGIGQTPFPAVAREALGLRRYGDPPRAAPACRRVTLCYGVRNREYFAGLEDFRELDIDLRLSTDDGSFGHHGLVTHLLSGVLNELEFSSRRILCCGPERMMEAVAEIAHLAGVSCQVSLESPMACGIGVCFSCVTKVRSAHDESWDYKRTCVEGPVFDAEQIVW